MKPFLVLACALLAAPTLSLAQSAPPSIAAAADPAAVVPAPVYRSALTQGPHGVASDSVDWKAANAEVGQFRRGHNDILKWEQAQVTATPDQTAPCTSSRARPGIHAGADAMQPACPHGLRVKPAMTNAGRPDTRP